MSASWGRKSALWTTVSFRQFSNHQNYWTEGQRGVEIRTCVGTRKPPNRRYDRNGRQDGKAKRTLQQESSRYFAAPMVHSLSIYLTTGSLPRGRGCTLLGGRRNKRWPAHSERSSVVEVESSFASSN